MGDMQRERADARQNRERILAAADVVFQRLGVHAPLDAVIAEAGVGKTTFFRRFPDRQTLLATLLERSMDELRVEAEQVRERADALFHILAFTAERIGLRVALAAYWNAADPAHPAIQAAMAEVEPIFGAAIARAIAAGLCRPDLHTSDMVLVGRLLASAALADRSGGRAGAARAAQLLLEGYAARPVKPDEERQIR